MSNSSLHVDANISETMHMGINTASLLNLPSTSSISMPSEATSQYDLMSLSNSETALLLRSLPDAYFPRRHLHLPKKAKTLVLDLDETLIHSTSKSCKKYDTMIEVLMNKASCLYYVLKRPHVDYFLKKVSEWYNLVIYTASLSEYADPVIDWLDGGSRLFQKRYFRPSCIYQDGLYSKDLTIVESDLSRVILVDNSPISYTLHPENAIPISSWMSDTKDEALLDLLPFLDALRFTEDVRSILSLRKNLNSKQ